MTTVGREIPLLLFAKTPVAGNVKTRLQPQCTPRQCVEVARILIIESIRIVRQAWPGSVSLLVWPDTQDPFLRQLANKHNLQLQLQAEGDLGQKMYAAMQHAGYPVAVMGCDVPDISAAHLRRACQLLHDGQEIIGPSADGGYYLLGLTRPAPEMFAGICWSSDRVLAQTRARATASGRELYSLPMLNDVDSWHDLVASRVPALKTFVRSLRRE